MTMIRSEFLGALGATTVAQVAPFAQSLTIAVVAPFTGPDKRLGERLADGVRAALDDANNARTALDRVFVMRTFDDVNAVGSAITNAGFATGDSNVIAVIGHLNSRGTVAAIPTYASAQMPVIVPVSTDDAVTATNYRNIFRLATKDSTEGAIIAKSAVAQYKPKTPHVFVQNADYGADVTNGFVAQCASLGVSARYTQFDYERPNFGAIATLGLSEHPDFILLAGTAADMGPLLPALRSAGYTGPIVASSGFFAPETLALGAAANGLTVTSSMPYLTLAPSAQRQKTDFEQHYGALAPIAAFGYAAAQIFIGAQKRNGATARNALLRAIASGIPFQTLIGQFAFLTSGDPIDPELYFYSVGNGAFSYVRQAHPSSFMLK